MLYLNCFGCLIKKIVKKIYVITDLTSLLPLPVCEVEVVVEVGVAVLGVPQHRVEEGLGGEQGQAEHSPQARHQLITDMGSRRIRRREKLFKFQT